MTTQTSFSFNAMIKSGYQLFKNHAKFIISAGLVTVIIQVLLQLIQNGAKMEHGNFIIQILATLFVTLIGLIVSIGWAKVFLKLTKGDGANWNDFKSESALWLKFIKVYIWYALYFIAYAFVASILFITLPLLDSLQVTP
jgi:hypothetical protein